MKSISIYIKSKNLHLEVKNEAQELFFWWRMAKNGFKVAFLHLNQIYELDLND